MPYTYKRPDSALFTGKGLLGYSFGPLKHKDLDVYYIEVEKGHDVFEISKKITRIYYVLSGSGFFTIEGNDCPVDPGMLVEVPPKLEYCYSGKMTLLAFCTPRYIRGNDKLTKWNAAVVGHSRSYRAVEEKWFHRVVRSRVLGKSPFGGFLWLNQRLWSHIPRRLRASGPLRSYGDFLHTLVRIRGVRAQALNTYFLRNRPELELIRRLVKRKTAGETIRVTVLGCSTGPEVYSIASTIRSARPDLKLMMHAVDISRQAVEFAERGVYPLTAEQLSSTDVTESMTEAEIDEFFEKDENQVRVKPWIKEGIQWHVADAAEPEIIDVLGHQDFVVANNFLCHMNALEAEKCLRNIGGLIKANGYVFVSGVDLDIRTNVARDLKWEPMQELIEELHEADFYTRRCWPFHYAGAEPLNKKRKDWRFRYAAAFHVPCPATESSTQKEVEIVERSRVAGVSRIVS